MACGILLVTHPGIGPSILAVASALLRQLPLKTEAFEVPLDADLESLLPQASAALRRVDGGEGVLVVAWTRRIAAAGPIQSDRSCDQSLARSI